MRWTLPWSRVNVGAWVILRVRKVPGFRLTRKVINLLFAMKCFPFYIGEKRDELKSPKPSSSLSWFTDREVRSFASEFSLQDASDSSSVFGRAPQIPDKPSDLRAFTFLELKQATRNFSTTVKLGEGGFGCVYKGIIRSSEDPTDRIVVAVKQLNTRGLQGHKEWVTEVNVLGIVEHPNLVKLIGYCAEDYERGIHRLLVYEYMPNGSVEDHLSSRSRTPLSWDMRLKIALDSARGLAYLHEEMSFQIIFRDFKSSNILLDDQWNAKLSDFGLARLGPSDGLTHVSTQVVGTIGYAAPEYVHTGRLRAKSDIWSYGVFLYELITGRLPLDHNRPRNEQKLLEWIKPHISNSRMFQHIIDPRLPKQQILKSAHRLSLLANRCLSRKPKSRPKMSEIREMVREIVEASAGTHLPQLPSISREEQKRNPHGHGHRHRHESSRRTRDSGWLLSVWASRLLKSC